MQLQPSDCRTILDFMIAPSAYGYVVAGPFKQLPFLFDNRVLASMLLVRVVHKENLHVFNPAAQRELDRYPLVDASCGLTRG